MSLSKAAGLWIVRLLLGLLALILLTALGLFVINLRLPTEMENAAELDDLTRARIDEIFHLRQTLGDEVWPGWGEAEIPVILYNEDYAFLFGYPEEPPDGWRAVGALQPIGEAWQSVPGAHFAQGHYFCAPLPAEGTTPQAFTVQIGDVWVASLGQYEWMAQAVLLDCFVPGWKAQVLADGVWLDGLLQAALAD